MGMSPVHISDSESLVLTLFPKLESFLKSLSEKAMATTTAKKTTGELLCWWHNREPATKVEGQKCSEAH